MNNISNLVIDMVYINDDGTVELIDITSGNWIEHSIRWRYKLYYDFSENQNRLFEAFNCNSVINFKASKRFHLYLEDRKLLFKEVSNNYLPMINSVLNSDLSEKGKKDIINLIDIELNKKYPYSNNHQI